MKAWSDAASLILAARHGQTYSRMVSPAIHNYKLLCLKRHQKSSFMPGLYVFPGGTVDPADVNLKWYEYFSTFGLDNDRLASLVPKTVSRPQLFQSKENELLREISLRITAIRETFEECGILLCRRKDGDAHSSWAEHVSIPEGELQTWQNKVHNDATEFLNLCQKLECYPDLWALYEWRNWLGPTYERKIKRFNTAFYLACIPHMPHAEYEAIEMEDLQWFSPEEFSSTCFGPPQQIEIARLTKIKSIDNLLDIAKERNKKGVQELYLPVAVQLKDGIVFVIPEDTMYPKEIELYEQQIIDKSDITVDEFEKITLIKNRIIFLDTQVNIIFTDNGKDNRVVFPRPGYHSNRNVESKNKL
ncbi:PREDICTED: nucleoside diphosphate-linked moiety X motif 19-like [Trachymyrmex septentrionalis]|uniref:nucleoside diphosphate-linked moiety X motif 19-like n=1 Tax=Trachymyrmex septentrionalis TaxID=34720 RepID=UPI00084F41A5|nr:PREDICTED: nucleoside diphosphate-linked moiety X motif 19-like [Trachymyrmex septentrionalis]XP_018338290.1 PREDICTED: nucleoside diphosphate-linked moiety X motif 19-like [Trachymyrmex septentrionalis]XP_018338291.1 PREDICTED: nucleoside diphosphate-linked moiety X motif 19-like [Trachymyrmex septentrionalis]